MFFLLDKILQTGLHLMGKTTSSTNSTVYMVLPSDGLARRQAEGRHSNVILGDILERWL